MTSGAEGVIVAHYAECESVAKGASLDVAYMGGGILHYFGDPSEVFGRTQELLKPGGRFVLNGSHPFRKYLPDRVPTAGDYFDIELHDAPVAHEDMLDGADPSAMPPQVLDHRRDRDIGEVCRLGSLANGMMGTLRDP